MADDIRYAPYKRTMKDPIAPPTPEEAQVVHAICDELCPMQDWSCVKSGCRARATESVVGVAGCEHDLKVVRALMKFSGPAS